MGVPELLFFLFFIVLAVVGIAVPLWALIDAAQRPDAAFVAAGQTKTMWILLIALGWVVCGIVGIVAGAIYLINIRPQIIAAQNRPYGYGQ